MRKRRAARLVEEELSGVAVDADASDGEVGIRLDENGTTVATISDDPPPTDESPTGEESDAGEIRLEYLTDGDPSGVRKATQVMRLLSRRAR